MHEASIRADTTTDTEKTLKSVLGTLALIDEFEERLLLDRANLFGDLSGEERF